MKRFQPRDNIRMISATPAALQVRTHDGHDYELHWCAERAQWKVKSGLYMSDGETEDDEKV